MSQEEFVAAAVVSGAVRRNGDGETERTYLRTLRDRSNPFERSERKFRKMFRLSRSMGRHLVDVLCADEALNEGGIPAHLKVLCALHFFAHGSYQTAVGEVNVIAQSQPSVSRNLAAVCNAIIQHLTPEWIKFPVTTEDKTRTMQEFQETFGMPHTIGAVDGTHIGIHKPPLNHPTAPGNIFYNRKGFYSINCQVICDAKGRITSVNPNFPGSTHDAAIWRSSNVNQYLERQFTEEQPMEWLLGDKGYPLLPWLMTPHSEPAPGSAEERYNKCHAAGRGTVEMCFGMLKNKLRCLHRHHILHYSPEKAAQIIISCCTMHNILRWSENHEHLESSDSDSDEDTSESELSSSSSSTDSDDDSTFDASDDNDVADDNIENVENVELLEFARQRRNFLIRSYFQ